MARIKTIYNIRMVSILQKISFLLELFFNGSFILFYFLFTTKKLPANWSAELIDSILSVGVKIVPITIFIGLVTKFIEHKNVEDVFRKYIFSLIVFAPLVISWGDLQFSFWLASVHLLSSVLSLYDKEEQNVEDKKAEQPVVNSQGSPQASEEIEEYKRKTEKPKKFRLSPAQLVLGSFLSVILIGTFLLLLPVSTYENVNLSFVDAIFMATSATCVTGLSTLSLASDFTFFGQLVVLVLIQIGGLSIMTLASSMTILLGKSMQMKDRMIMQDLLDVSSQEELFAMIINIVKYTFLIELWGGIILTIAFTFEGFEFGRAIYYGFFHSVSAFCNAGFALFDTSLESYATSPLIHGTIAVLITFGGLGFIVLKELKEVIVTGKSLARIGLHTKVVLVTSLILTVGGAIFIFFGEFLNALDGYNPWEKLQVSIFQSITLRTAGFNTLPLTNLNTYTIYFMSLIMFIGGSPGSTAGGIKTTTLAILFQSIKSTLKGDQKVNMMGRTVPAPIVVRTTALTFISILIVSFFILILMKLEPTQSFLPIFFEAMSASGTVGLTLGVTPYLTVLGKVAISLLMLIGRVGPLTLILAIGERENRGGKFDYPKGRIMIG